MSLVGCVDTLAGTCISGWAADDSDFGRRVDVEVAVNSQIVATVPCTAFREDLRAAGIGDGCKAFECDPSAHLIPGRTRFSCAPRLWSLGDSASNPPFRVAGCYSGARSALGLFAAP